MSLPNEKIMKMFFVYQRTQTSTVSCSEIISEYVCSLQYQNIPKNASNSKATAQYLWEKYQMNRFKRVITVLQKKRNFYQIRFTNWILKTFAVLITLFSRSPPRLLIHMTSSAIHGINLFWRWGGGWERYRNIILTLFHFMCLYNWSIIR